MNLRNETRRATYLRDDLTRPQRLRDWHHVTGVPNNEIGEAATFGVVADQLATSVRKEYSLGKPDCATCQTLTNL